MAEDQIARLESVLHEMAPSFPPQILPRFFGRRDDAASQAERATALVDLSLPSVLCTSDAARKQLFECERAWVAAVRNCAACDSALGVGAARSPQHHLRYRWTLDARKHAAYLTGHQVLCAMCNKLCAVEPVLESFAAAKSAKAEQIADHFAVANKTSHVGSGALVYFQTVYSVAYALTLLYNNMPHTKIDYFSKNADTDLVRIFRPVSAAPARSAPAPPSKAPAKKPLDSKQSDKHAEHKPVQKQQSKPQHQQHQQQQQQQREEKPQKQKKKKHGKQ